MPSKKKKKPAREMTNEEVAKALFPKKLRDAAKAEVEEADERKAKRPTKRKTT